MATDLHVMPGAPDPPDRPQYRLTLNVSGRGFDIDVSVDGVTRLTPHLQRLLLDVLDEAVRATYDDGTGGDDHGQHG